ncbi:Glucan endo-1 3-beta-glucosidase 13 [Bienertia sinuspersici]
MKRIWFCNTLLIIACFLVDTMGNDNASVEEKAEATMPVPMTSTQSPPEGNTTFLDGTTWCVAHPWASENDLQRALDWACGVGKADCSPIRDGGPCYQPNTVASHASYAFNIYYQQNGNNDIACNFGGTATLTKKDPSISFFLHLPIATYFCVF